MAQFIKVTPKGSTKPRIVMATLKAFYIAQGAKVEIPTEEEIYAAEPALRPRTVQAPVSNAVPANVSAEIARLKALNTELEKTIDGLRSEVTGRDAAIKERDNEIASLHEKLNASDTALAETEKALEAARKELAKTSKEDKAEKGAK